MIYFIMFALFMIFLPFIIMKEDKSTNINLKTEYKKGFKQGQKEIINQLKVEEEN